MSQGAKWQGGASGEMVDAALAGLTPRKRKLYELLMEERRRQEESRWTIPRHAGTGPARLSSSQERLWFLCELDPSSAVFNIPYAMRLRGALDLAFLAGALREIVRRHEPLRTRFSVRDGEPAQSVEPGATLRLTVTDLSGLPARCRRDEGRRLAVLESRHPIPTGRPPLLRCTVVREEPRSHLLLLTVHHLAADGWSVGVMVRELGALYSGFATGEPAKLPPLTVRYADYAEWQRRQVEAGTADAQLRYWKGVLADPPPPLELPTDRPRGALPAERGKAFSFVLPAELSRHVSVLGRSRDATLFMVLYSAFAALLHRYSGQSDFCVGTPVANRGRVELEALVGMFVNTLVLRAAPEPDEPFVRLLERARRRILGAYEHQELPFGTLVEELRPRRAVSHTPLFQVMFVLQNAPVRPPELPGLDLEMLENRRGVAEFDLTLLTRELRDGRLSGALEIDAALFDDTTALRMIGHYRRILEQVVEAPDRPVAALDLLRREEAHQLLREWNDRTDRPAGEPRSGVHDLVYEWVERTPDAVAVEGGGRTLSFREMGARAARTARRLRSLGVRPGATVAVCVRRSPEQVVALLAVLESGAAFVPIDPDYPAERIRHLLEDSEARALIAEPGLEAAETFPPDRVVWCTGPEGPAGVPPIRLGTGAGPDHGAYTIYTSGSTGRPKGVQVPHRALAHHCRVLRRRYRLGPGDRALQFVSLGFDVAVQEIFPTLASGAAVFLRSEELAGAVSRFVREVDRHRLTVLNIPTPYWHEWAAAVEEDKVSVPVSVRVLIVGTEQTSHERWRQWLRAVGNRVRLINGYGPTEATIEATFYEPERAEARPSHGGVAIGRPFEGASAFVVDPRGRPTPPGVPGELLVGGAGLAWGYRSRPGLTAERFVPDATGVGAGARLYRTGDLARHRPDGVLECLGRIDDQVKVRGFRVELGEVESALAELPRVREAAAVAAPDGVAGRRLVACVVPADGASSLEPGALRAALAERLPDYMVPTGFVFLDRLPLTPHGKLDRRALERLDAGAAGAGTEYVAPRGATEEIVARVWAEVLGVERVGVEDNFFDLGGHSLLMIRVQTRLSEVLERPVTLMELFRSPTVTALARHLDGGASDESKPKLAERRSRAGRRATAVVRRRGRRSRAQAAEAAEGR